MITGLLIVYFLNKEEEEVSALADESFAIGSSTSAKPDLAEMILIRTMRQIRTSATIHSFRACRTLS